VLSPGRATTPEGASPQPPTLPYCVVDTGQRDIFSDRGQLLKPPKPGEPFFGQDGFYQGPQPSYRASGDGTVSDLNTGLMWLKTPLGNRKLTFAEARETFERLARNTGSRQKAIVGMARRLGIDLWRRLRKARAGPRAA